MQINDVPAAVWTTISAIGVAVASGIFTAWASKAKTKADVQTVINQGFAQLVDKLNNRIQAANAEVDRCHEERERAQATTERIRRERDDLSRHLEIIRQQNHDFRNCLMKHNIPIKRNDK
jgi:chromosome segregation ATPase